jgi:hypothetical protein
LNGRENVGNWGQKLRCVFEIDVPQNTKLRVNTTALSPASQPAPENLASLTPK